jgi:hypothetical protein
MEAFQTWIAGPNFRNGYFALTLGLIAKLLGFWGLYPALADSRAERLALAWLLTSFVGVAANIMIHGVAVLVPGAYPDFAAALFAPSPPPAMLAGAALVQLSVLGALLFGLAIWRSGRLPVWVAAAYVLHRLAFDFGGVAGFPVEASGVLWLLLSGLAVVRLGRRPATGALASATAA